MKLKRDEFKAMLKECILELVNEGKIFHGSPASGMSRAQQSAESKDSINENSRAQASSATPNSRLNEAVQMTARQVGKGDPKRVSMFESIIADTARTTLQKQLSSQMSGGEMMEGAVLPEERAFDAAQLGAFAAKDRWATLAFGNKSKTNSGG